MTDNIDIETHPWKPFIPPHAKVLIMGTFPPAAKRWSMDFYYPNRTNDFWYMMGLIFFDDRYALATDDRRGFKLDVIKRLLTEKGIAMNDTAYKVRRLMGNASDKYLDIVEPTDIYGLLSLMPECHTIATTGEKAAGVVAEQTHSLPPRMGQMISTDDGLEIWRMPSTSRAYPLALDKKAEYYASMFRHIGII